jgi:CubicO group peptidase (beta-lactamase class C family)
MRVASRPSDVVVPAGSSVGPRVSRQATAVWLQLVMAALCIVNSPSGSQAAAATHSQPPMEARVRALRPALEAYLARGMKAFDVPGLAIGIVAGDKLVYAKGFGVRSKGGGVPVDTRTIFQIGSTTKAFLATTLAIMVDRRHRGMQSRTSMATVAYY